MYFRIRKEIQLTSARQDTFLTAGRIDGEKGMIVDSVWRMKIGKEALVTVT